MSDESIRKLERELARSGRSPRDYALEILDLATGTDRDFFTSILVQKMRHAPEPLKRSAAIELLLGRAPGNGVEARVSMNVRSPVEAPKAPATVALWVLVDIDAEWRAQLESADMRQELRSEIPSLPLPPSLPLCRCGSTQGPLCSLHETTEEMRHVYDLLLRLDDTQRGRILCWFCKTCDRHVPPGDHCECGGLAP